MNKEIGRRIREERTKQGFTQEYLAKASGVNLRTIQRIECGEVNPRPSTVKLIFEVLEIDFDNANNNKSSQHCVWLVIMHLSSIMPFAIVPLLVMTWKKEDHPDILVQGRDILNFQISMIIYLFSASLLVFVVIGIPILIFMGIFISFFAILNSIKASYGKEYKYPLTISFIKDNWKL